MNTYDKLQQTISYWFSTIDKVDNFFLYENKAILANYWQKKGIVYVKYFQIVVTIVIVFVPMRTCDKYN